MRHNRYHVEAMRQDGTRAAAIYDLLAESDSAAKYIAAHYWGFESRPDLIFEATAVGYGYQSQPDFDAEYEAESLKFATKQWRADY